MTGSATRARRFLGQTVGVSAAPAVAFLGARLSTRGAVVLTYHDVTADPRNRTDQVTPADLRAQLDAVRRWGVRFVGLRELVDRLLRDEPVDGLAAIVFDDALVGVHRDGLPILDDLGVPATVFVVSSRLGTTEPSWYPGSDRTMTRAELLETVTAGLEIESHTRTHPDLPTVAASELADELAGSRAELEDLVGHPVDLLAYPSGHYDRGVVDATTAAGYRAAFTFRPGRLAPGLDRYRLPRLPMWSRHRRLRLAYNLARPAGSFPDHQLDAIGQLDAVGQLDGDRPGCPVDRRDVAAVGAGPVSRPELRTEVRPSLAGFEREWDALVDAAPLPSPFLRSWWLEAVAGPRPRFLLVFDGDALAGGLAVEEDEVLNLPRLRTIGDSMGADHLDLVAAANLVDEVVRALREWFGRPGARLVDLVGVSEDARVGAALPGRVRREVLDRAPWSPLPGTLEEYVAQRPPELKNLVNRPLRRLTRDGVEHRVVDADGCEPALVVLRDLHEAQWGERSEFLPGYERFARAARAGVPRGELVLHELAVEGRVIAVSVFFEVAGRASFYQTGRDDDRRWRGSGTALMALGIGHACDRGCREFDLLRGAESYKRIWASSSRDVVRLRAARGARAGAMLMFLPLGSALRSAGRQARSRMRRKGRAVVTRTGSEGDGT